MWRVFASCGRSFHGSLDTRLETSDNFPPPTEELGKAQLLPHWKILLLSQLRDVYLTGTCDVLASCRPGRQGRGWSRAAGTCSCHWARSGCVPPRASSHSAGPCRGTACRPWPGDQPEGKENVREEGGKGREREEKCPERRATAIATRMARWACTGCTNGSTRESSPSVRVVNKLSHDGPQKTEEATPWGINHDYFRDMQRRHHASRPAKVTCLAEL